MRENVRDVMLEAVESGGFETLRLVVKSLAAVGQTHDSLLRDLDDIRALLPEEQEDTVLDVMDCLVGRVQKSLQIPESKRDTN